MVYNLNYKFEGEDFTLYVSEFWQDVIDYMMLQYDRAYPDLAGLQKDKREAYYKSIEKSWWKNTFDSFKLYHDIDFLDWLSDRYITEAFDNWEASKLKYSNGDELINEVFRY